MQGNSQTNIITVAAGLFCVAILAAVFAAAEQEDMMKRLRQKSTASYRGICQSMIIFGNSNNDYLPGLNTKGEILKAIKENTGSNTLTGAAASSRLWMLLNGQFIGGDLVISPAPPPAPPEGVKRDDTKPRYIKWTKGGPVTTANHSVAMLQIAESTSADNTKKNEDRAKEWMNNANSQAVVLSDFNSGRGEADVAVSSLWTNKAGDWKGSLMWGDCHGEFSETPRGYVTRYVATTNKSDNLFAVRKVPGVSESSEKADANAMMTYDDEVGGLAMLGW